MTSKQGFGWIRTIPILLLGVSLSSLAWMDRTSAQDNAHARQGFAAFPGFPSGARLVETHTLTHSVAERGDYKIVFENFEYDNVTEGFSALRIYNEIGQLDYAEFGQPTLIAGLRPITLRSGNTDLLIAEYRRPYDRRYPAILRIYNLDDAAQSRAVLLLADGPGTVTGLAERVGDFDQDGNIEVLNYCQPPLAGLSDRVAPSQSFCTLSIYRYVAGPRGPDWTPRFERVKGRGFEKQLVEHADWLINEKYPEAVRFGNGPIVRGVILSWLATVESTQNRDRIREALQKLDALPSIKAETKRSLVELLATHGYPLLRAPRP